VKADFEGERERLHQVHQREMEQMEQKVNRVRDEKANDSKEMAGVMLNSKQLEGQLKV